MEGLILTIIIAGVFFIASWEDDAEAYARKRKEKENKIEGDEVFNKAKEKQLW